MPEKPRDYEEPLRRRSPEKMFTKQARNREMTFATVRDLAEAFEASLTATAIRLVELGSYPAMLVCNDRARRRGFIRGPDVPDVLCVDDHRKARNSRPASGEGVASGG